MPDLFICIVCMHSFRINIVVIYSNWSSYVLIENSLKCINNLTRTQCSCLSPPLVSPSTDTGNFTLTQCLSKSGLWTTGGSQGDA